MQFRNTTDLDTDRLRQLVLHHTHPYRHDQLSVWFRPSRSAVFSGACYYRDGRIFVNLGRRNRYPFTLGTSVARAESNRTHWWRAIHRLTVADAYQLGLFIYLHELFHYLVKAAGRGVKRREAMCDRFATRVLVDDYGCPLSDPRGAAVPRETWDFQDLHALIAAAPKEAPAARPVVAPVAQARIVPPPPAAAARPMKPRVTPQRQLPLPGFEPASGSPAAG